MTRPHLDQTDRDVLDDGGLVLDAEPAHDDDTTTDDRRDGYHSSRTACVTAHRRAS